MKSSKSSFASMKSLNKRHARTQSGREVPLTQPVIRKMVQMARKAMKNARAPYSGYHVGAAMLASDGTIHAGCNMENVSYGATVCAERSALARAVAEGKKKFLAVAVVAGDKKRPIPCGICRQVLWEVAGEIEVVIDHEGKLERHRLSELYPQPFEKTKKR